jgi:hypothetical protein
MKAWAAEANITTDNTATPVVVAWLSGPVMVVTIAKPTTNKK